MDLLPLPAVAAAATAAPMTKNPPHLLQSNKLGIMLWSPRNENTPLSQQTTLLDLVVAATMPHRPSHHRNNLVVGQDICDIATRRKEELLLLLLLLPLPTPMWRQRFKAFVGFIVRTLCKDGNGKSSDNTADERWSHCWSVCFVTKARTGTTIIITTTARTRYPKWLPATLHQSPVSKTLSPSTMRTIWPARCKKIPFFCH
mmetsp:Transcript_6829/g.19085  ORF Transcript_6829/g.19085 Transcript_6829/m.19085 type:complete len:201 (+) Transcript_6829:1287-1889(+)